MQKISPVIFLSQPPATDKRWRLSRYRLAAALILFFALFSVRVEAQNDFPFSPGIPSWNQPFLPTPTPGYDYKTGTAYGPVQLGNRKGDTIVLDYVLDWWGLGPLSTSVMSNAAQNTRWTGPNTRAGQWGHDPLGFWCLRCEWRFEAGDDNVWIWIDYIGSEQFGAHLEVKQVIPRPLFSVLTDTDKNTASNIATALWAASGVWAGAAIGFYSDPPLAAIFALMGYASDKFAGKFSEIARDPWDGDYCSGTPWEVSQQTMAELEWTQPYDVHGWFIASTEYIEAFVNQAITAANRALSADAAGATDCAWARRYESIWALNQMGNWMWAFRWSVEATADDYVGKYGDMTAMYEWASSLSYIASWLEGLQP
jgi:hypothetical protein